MYKIGLPLNVQPVHKRAWDKTKRHISLQAENRIFIWKSGTPGIYGTLMLVADAFSRYDSLRPSFTIKFSKGRGNEAGTLNCPICPAQMPMYGRLQNLPSVPVIQVCVGHLYDHTLLCFNCISVQCTHGLVGCPSCR